jgi:DNA-binding transcriptional MerR regulator
LTTLYLKPRDMAAAIGISERQLRYWQRNRVLSFVKIGKTVLFDPAVTKAEIDQFRRLYVDSPAKQEKIAKAVAASDQLN